MSEKMDLDKAHKQICRQSEMIMQLQAEITEAKKKIRSLEVTNTNIRLGDAQDWVALRADNERLREALEKIDNYDCDKGCGPECDTYMCTCRVNLMNIAWEALKENKDE